MNENTSHSESKELYQAKQLIDISNLDKAEEILNNFEEKGGHSLYNNVFCNLLKCKLLNERGFFDIAIKLAERNYKESLKLGKTLLSVDILLEIALGLLTTGQTDKAHDINNQSEELLKTLTSILPNEYKQREAYIAELKGWVHSQKLDIDQALKQFELGLSLREELGLKKEIARSIYSIAHVYMDRQDLDRASSILERGLSFAKESGNKSIEGGILFYMGRAHKYKVEFDRSIMYLNRSLTIYNELNNKFMTARILNTLAEIYMMKGEIDNSIKFYEESLERIKVINNKYIMADAYNSLAFCYKIKGELDRSLEYIEKSMALTHELGTFNPYDNYFLVQILIDKGDIELANNALHDFEQLNKQFKNIHINSLYLLDKASLLKTSSRALNRGKAEEILKQLLEDEGLHYGIKIDALLNLCELLLVDLQITNEMEVLEEIKPLISQLLDFSEISQSFWTLGETFLLQAKLALISLDLEEARRLLSQGQKITERYGLNQLAKKISSEHDQLLKQLEIWEELKDSKAPLAKRMELSHLNEQMEGMVKKRIDNLPKLEVELPVLLTVMSKDGKILLSNPFTADFTIDNAYFGSFLSSCNTFCDQILSESFDRVKFGQHTVLITTVNSFSICYMFQGQTYNARKKLEHFSEVLKKDSLIIKILENSYNKDTIVEVNENPSIEELIIESFMSDPSKFRMPFKAYDGDKPYVFASYTHADKLEVYPIIDYLNKMGINIWYDEGIPVSENWKKSIAVNLERCSKFLVFITPHIINSEYVRKEISFAVKKKKPFIAVYLKETHLPTELEFEIADIQAIMKFLIPKGEFFNKLKDILHESTHFKYRNKGIDK